MKKRILCALLAACLCLSLGACSGNEASGYRVVDSIGGQELCVAFRDGDRLRDIITAGMMVLSADGTLKQLSVKWLGEDMSIMPADADMAGWLQNQPQRVLILGYYKGARPMCYEAGGAVTGFDAEMFTELCARLGWELRFQAIERGTAAVELASGTVDCWLTCLPTSPRRTLPSSPCRPTISERAMRSWPRPPAASAAGET